MSEVSEQTRQDDAVRKAVSEACVQSSATIEDLRIKVAALEPYGKCEQDEGDGKAHGGGVICRACWLELSNKVGQRDLLIEREDSDGRED